MRSKSDELTVITKAKELTMYVMTVTEKSPKRFRFTLVSRMQNYCLDVIQELYFANDVLMTRNMTDTDIKKRREHQHMAMTKLRLLAYIAMLAREEKCITPPQYGQISEKTMEVQKILYAWEQSDKKRLESAGK